MKATRPVNANDWLSELADPVKGAMGEVVGCGPVTLGKRRIMLVQNKPAKKRGKGQLTILSMRRCRPGRYRMGSARM